MTERANGRHEMNYNWAKGFFYFTFGEYYNPRKLGVGRIKVANEFELNPQEEFGKDNKHTNFDIITLVLDGELRHNSSVKEKVLLEKGECHLLRIGSKEAQHGIQNTSSDQKGKFVEIWVNNNGKYVSEEGEQTTFKFDINRKKLNEEQRIFINENVSLDIIHVDKDQTITIDNTTLSQVFILTLNGSALYNDKVSLSDRDAITEIKDKYILKATEKCISVLIVKTV